jgi:hypothetical protein
LLNHCCLCQICGCSVCSICWPHDETGPDPEAMFTHQPNHYSLANKKTQLHYQNQNGSHFVVQW